MHRLPIALATGLSADLKILSERLPWLHRAPKALPYPRRNPACWLQAARPYWTYTGMTPFFEDKEYEAC